MDGYAGNVTTAHLHLTNVDTGTDLDPERVHRGHRLLRVLHRFGGNGQLGRGDGLRLEATTGPGAAQRFLAVLRVISPHFRPRRRRLTADDYRTEMTRRFAVWNRSAD